MFGKSGVVPVRTTRFGDYRTNAQRAADAAAASTRRTRPRTPTRRRKRKQSSAPVNDQIASLDARIAELESRLAAHTSSGSSAHSGNDTAEVGELKRLLQECRDERDELEERPDSPRVAQLRSQLAATKRRLKKVEQKFGNSSSELECMMEISRLTAELEKARNSNSATPSQKDETIDALRARMASDLITSKDAMDNMQAEIDAEKRARKIVEKKNTDLIARNAELKADKKRLSQRLRSGTVTPSPQTRPRKKKNKKKRSSPLLRPPLGPPPSDLPPQIDPRQLPQTPPGTDDDDSDYVQNGSNDDDSDGFVSAQEKSGEEDDDDDSDFTDAQGFDDDDDDEEEEEEEEDEFSSSNSDFDKDDDEDDDEEEEEEEDDDNDDDEESEGFTSAEEEEDSGSAEEEDSGSNEEEDSDFSSSNDDFDETDDEEEEEEGDKYTNMNISNLTKRAKQLSIPGYTSKKRFPNTAKGRRALAAAIREAEEQEEEEEEEEEQEEEEEEEEGDKYTNMNITKLRTRAQLLKIPGYSSKTRFPNTEAGKRALAALIRKAEKENGEKEESEEEEEEEGDKYTNMNITKLRTRAQQLKIPGYSSKTRFPNTEAGKTALAALIRKAERKPSNLASNPVYLATNSVYSQIRLRF